MKINIKFIFVYIVTIFFGFQTPMLAVNYYVNDAVLDANDTYTTAFGSNGNAGTSPALPKLTINAVVALGLVAGDIIYIDGGTFVEDILLSGVNGSAGLPILFQGNGTTKTIIRGVVDGAVIAYTIKLLNSSFISFQNIKVESVPAEWAFQIHNNSDNNIISNCEVDADQYAVDIIRFNGGAGGPSPDNNIVENCILNSNYVGIRIKSNNLGGWALSASLGPMNNIIRDNVVTVDGAAVYSALELHAIRPNTILRNVLSQTGDAGINGATIALVHFCAVQQIENNYVLNHTAYVNAGTTNSAISFDDNSGASLIHNSFYSVSHTLYFQDGGNANTLTNVTLYNNIFYSTTRDCIHFPSDNAKFNFCDGNMYYAPSGNVAHANGTNFNFASWQTYDPDGANPGSEALGFNANPAYAAPGTNNLDLNSGSPAIDVVDVATAVSNDIYSIARPNGPKKDVGAYESVVAPITLLYFNASCNQGTVMVTWITANEKDNDYFVLEKGETGMNDFEEVTRVVGKGTTSQSTTYQYEDINSDGAYYRIKQVDFDGNYSYTPITKSNCTSEKIIVLNFGDYADVICPNANEGDMIQIALMNAAGQVLIQKAVVLSSENTASFSFAELPSALYILNVNKENEVYSTKLLKQ